jgi:CDGSH-type Zn-finger protein
MIVIARRDASLEVSGDLRLCPSDGREIVDAGRALLCRCGQRATKPFCDSSHKRVGFRSFPAETPHDRLEAEAPAAFAANPRVLDPRSGARAG